MKIWSFFISLFVLLSFTEGQGQENADFYAADPNIYELTPSNFDRVIQKSNYTSIVKFYAPWCGYCKQLYPAFTKLGRLMHKEGQYAVNVAAVNCDKNYNKELCSRYRVSGFPTLMVFRPPKYDKASTTTRHKHAVEPYNGERNLKSMNAFITSRIKNYVKRYANINSESLKEWLVEDTHMKKMLVISSSQAIHPMLKSLAIDFMNSTQIGFISAKTLDQKTITVNGEEISIPEGDLPLLMLYENGEFTRFTGSPKLNDKLKISEWLVEKTGVVPLEGPLSTREREFTKFVREGNKKNLSKSKSRSKTKSKSKNEGKKKDDSKSNGKSKSIIHDEL